MTTTTTTTNNDLYACTDCLLEDQDPGFTHPRINNLRGNLGFIDWDYCVDHADTECSNCGGDTYDYIQEHYDNDSGHYWYYGPDCILCGNSDHGERFRVQNCEYLLNA